ncbi:MAG: leucine-rich repeat protein [Bacteroidaceae bacterium]|nr:leucine-rich repeat protein [Bacteroidaceae bacterium]
MKHFSFSILLAVVLSLLGGKAMAYDIAVEDADGVMFYYDFINYGAELELTQYNASYTGVVAIPEEVTYMNRTRKVTSIGYGTFACCSGLTSVTIPNSVTSIGEGAFYGCSGLTSVIIPNSLMSIGDYAFYGCSNLTSVMIPNSVMNIGKGAFRRCTSLASITIPEGVTRIGEWTFDCCSSLTSINISSGVSSIGNWAFGECPILTSITCLATTPPTCEDEPFYEVPTSTCVLTVPAESVAAYQTADYWKEFATILSATPILQCSTPTISYVDGKIKLLCETEGAKCFCTVVAADNATVPVEVTSEGMTISRQYVITAYATAEGYTQSEPATLTITLGDGDLNGDGETNVSDVTKLVSIILGNQ